MTTFGTATFDFDVPSSGDLPLWLSEARIDRQELEGTNKTVLNVLGTSSPSWKGTVLCMTAAAYQALLAENTNRYPIAIGGITYTAMLIVGPATLRGGTLYAVQVEFKQC